MPAKPISRVPTNMTEMSDEEFEAFFFLRDNVKGLTFERWRHMHGCGRFFNAARDTVSDKFLTDLQGGPAAPGCQHVAADSIRPCRNL